MSRNRWKFSKSTIAIGVFGLAVGLLAGLTALITGQQGTGRGMGVVDDWTHHHLVFSNPGTAPDALAQGRFEQWYRIVNDPRYNMQQMKRNPAQRALATAPDFATLAARLSAPFGGPEPIRPAPWRNPKQSLKKDWSMNLGGVGASQTGTFTASSGTGTVVVNGSPTLTASPGTAASQSTTISGNGVASGNTITIYNPLNSSTFQLIANTPVAAVGEFTVGTSAPAVGAYDKIATIEYEFEASGWTNSSVPSSYCYINAGAGQSSIVAYLAAAISFNGSTNGSNTTWYCGTSATQPSSGVTLTSSTSPNVVVTAKIPGSSGISKTVSGTNAPTYSVVTAGSDGSSTSPYFQWWSGAAAVSAATLATNIITAIGATNAVGVGATSGGSGIVNITATLTGLAGRSINVATTIGSGLNSPAFNGNLTGGTAGTTSGLTFLTSTDSTSQATNLTNEAAALVDRINANVTAVTAAVTPPGGAVVTVTDKTVGPGGDSIGTTDTMSAFAWAGSTLGGGATATVGAGIYPAKYSFYTTTYNCATDFVAYNTGVAGGSSQATIIAYNELYAGLSPGCGTTGVPAIYWQYNTAYPYVSGGGGSADGSSIVTSVVLSGDTAGSQVAFIESDSSSVASLVVLKWSPSSSLVQMNSSTNNVDPTSYSTCTAPCMTRITFSGGHNDTKSSPFYDYGNDAIYVGDDNGSLHKFTGVFNGAPAEAGSPWPVLVSSANPLTGPVYDTSTGLVFVGDTVTGAPFHSVCAVTGINGVCTTAGTLTTSGTISATGVGGMWDAPIVDSRASKAYVLINTDTTTGCLSSGGSNVPCSDVFQYATATSIASGSQTPSKAIMGRSMGAGIPLYAGAFNDSYYSTGTGALYVCGGSPTNKSNQRPTLYKIAISGSTLTPTTGPYVAATSVGPFCSPVTEVLNGSNDYLFMSITAYAGNTSCPGGCIYSYIIPTGTFDLTHPPVNASLTATGGTSGIVIDNTTNTTGASQVYFSTLSNQSCVGNGATGSGTGGCAVQASQSALH